MRRNQRLDDGGARGRRAESFLLHRLAQFFVFDKLACRFHRAENRRFRVANWRPRLVCFDFDAHNFDALALSHGRQIFFRLLIGSFAAINLQPSGCDQNFSFGLERLAFHTCDPSGVLVLCRWKEHSHEAFGHHVEDRVLVVIE